MLSVITLGFQFAKRSVGALMLLTVAGLGVADSCAADAIEPLRVAPFEQHVHTAYDTDDGLPASDVLEIAAGPGGQLYARTSSGLARFSEGRWARLTDDDEVEAAGCVLGERERFVESLPSHGADGLTIRDLAVHNGETVVAAEEGIFVLRGEVWERVLPQMGSVRWAPVDVRAVEYDREGGLWFAAPQGVGVRRADGQWQLFTGADGLPFNDFTCAASGPRGVWFGTTNGAIYYCDGEWYFRQGGRWLINNHVQDIAVDRDGTAWMATAGGVSKIESAQMTLAEKAAFFEAEIEKHHRRTSFGYVNPADLSVAGDRATAVPTYSDNDGFNTGLYLAAMSHAYAATDDVRYRGYADRAFRALAFLSEVTQGGEHPAPPGFIARNVVPTSEADPNTIYDLAYDLRRQQADTLWKVMQPRCPVDASGEWYWKCDSSSDELDGHFFGYASYFDLVCQTAEEKEAVRAVAKPIIDHLLVHNFNLVDHDGEPTRWGRFSPDELNRDPAWSEERGLNSYSMLTYLSIAHHITGEERYRQVYRDLAFEQGYAMNGMTQPKALSGPHSVGHQPDDNMAFLNYYHLIRYERDPVLLSMYQEAIRRHWQYERLERNPFANFIYAACAMGKTRRDQWGEDDLTPPQECFDDAVETLRRYPLDLIEWPMSNAHRTDLMAVGEPAEGRGGRCDGYTFQIDERHETYWDWDPWALTSAARGTRLRSGFHYLLAYYLGRSHGFFSECEIAAEAAAPSRH